MIKAQSSASPSRQAFWTGSLYYLFVFIAAGSYVQYLFVHYNEMGLSGSQIGTIATLSPVMMMLSLPISAFADRKRNRVRILRTSLILGAVVILLLGYAQSFAPIFALMFVLALVNSPTMSLADGLISRMARRYSLNYGAMRLWGSFGYAASALFFGAVWQRFGFDGMFITASLLFLPLIFTAGHLEEAPGQDSGAQSKPLAILEILKQDRGLAFLILATFLSGIANSLAMTFGGIYVRELGGGNFVVGMMIAFGAFAELPAMYYSSRLARKFSPSNLILMAYGLFIIGYFGYVFAPNANLIPWISIIKGLGYGFWITNTIHLLTERTPAHLAGTSQSLLTISMMGLAPLVAGPLGGWLHDTIGPASVFWLCILSLFLAGCVLKLAQFFKYLD